MEKKDTDEFLFVETKAPGIVVNGVRGQKSKGRPGSLPPQLEISVMCRKVFRFVTPTGVTTEVVTPSSIIAALGGVCTVTNTTFKPWASSFRLKRLSIWPGLSVSAADEADVIWSTAVSQFVKDSERNREVPLGASTPAVLTFKPPKGCLASFWQTASSATLFYLTCGSGSVVDMEVEFTLSNQIVQPTQAIATGVLSTVYYLYLDGSANHLVKPVGLPSTF